MPMKVDENGNLKLPQRVAKDLGGASLRLVSHSRQHLLLSGGGVSEEFVLSGVLGEISVVDLLSFFNMFRKSGVLSFFLKGGRKELYLKDGEVVSASSSFLEERLGEVLYELGMVDRETLEKALISVAKGEKLGRTLVRRGAISPKELWDAARHQVEAIVCRLFVVQDGFFNFVSREIRDEEILQLSMSTQNLIMEGLRQLDERQLFAGSIASLEAIPQVTDVVPVKLSISDKVVYELVRQQVGTVREVVRRSRLGEFDGLKGVHHLLEFRAISLVEPSPQDVSGKLAEILTIYNVVLAAIFQEVSNEVSQFSQQVQFFLREIPPPYSFVFRGVKIQDDGTLDGGRVLENLGGLAEGDKEMLLADSLKELLFRECLSLRRDLGNAAAAELMTRSQDVYRRVKSLIGKD